MAEQIHARSLCSQLSFNSVPPLSRLEWYQSIEFYLSDVTTRLNHWSTLQNLPRLFSFIGGNHGAKITSASSKNQATTKGNTFANKVRAEILNFAKRIYLEHKNWRKGSELLGIKYENLNKLRIVSETMQFDASLLVQSPQTAV